MAVIIGTPLNDDGTFQQGQVRPELIGTADPDLILGGKGNDVMRGRAGNDVLLGDKGNDVMIGEADNDQLFGAKGDDLLFGGDGADQLFVSSGRDVITGGNGADQFIVSLSQTDAPLITDFTPNVDVFRVASFSPSGSSKNSFAQQSGELSQGEIDPSQFTVGEAAVDENTNFIYNDQSGELFFDPDGTGEQSQRLLATLESDPSTGLPPSLGSSDISITNDQPPINSGIGDSVFPPIGGEVFVPLPDVGPDIALF